MKTIDKPVNRVMDRPYMGRITDARGRRIVVTLMPGGVIAFRPQGLGNKRTVFSTTDDCYERAYWAELRAKQAAKRGRR